MPFIGIVLFKNILKKNLLFGLGNVFEEVKKNEKKIKKKWDFCFSEKIVESKEIWMKSLTIT